MATSALPTGNSGSKPASVRKHGIFRNPNLHRWLRTFHRAAGLIFAIFMAVVGITGVLVEIEMLLGPGAHGGRGVYGTTVHFLIMDLHTFFIFGKGPGLVVELLVTSALLLFCISGVWFYAALFRQWLKLAVKGSGYVPSNALRAANRFMACIAVALLLLVMVLSVESYIDWLVSRSASLAANAAHLPPPPQTFGAALQAYYSVRGPVVMMTIIIVTLIYFILVGAWYSSKVFAGWRRSKAAHPGQPAQPTKAMRTIHRWLSVPFGLYLIVIASTGAVAIPGLWGAGHLPFLYSTAHLQNLKRDAIIARNKTLPPDKQIPLPRERFGPPPNGGGAPGGAPSADGAAPAGGFGGGMMARVDTDQDGKVSPAEYTALAEQRWTRVADGADQVSLANLDDRAKRAFAEITPDAGGNVTHAAFIAGQAAAFKKADANGDGSLDAAELTASLGGGRGGRGAPGDGNARAGGMGGGGGPFAGGAPGNGDPRAAGPRGGGDPRAGGPGGGRPRRTLPLYGLLQQYLVEVHSGNVFGPAGRIFVIFAGLALIFFSFSGIWMYVTMYFPRRESGRKGLIWH